MASRRKQRKAEDFDPLGGFSLEQLLGLDPVLELEKKQSILGAPFRLIGALIKLPFKLVGALLMLPFKLLRAILPPYGRSTAEATAD